MNQSDSPSRELIERLVREALLEDVGEGDATTLATIPPTAESSAGIIAREPMVVCGSSLVSEVFRQVDPTVEVKELLPDGASAPKGAEIIRIKGASRALLTGERVALNYLQRLAGVATATRRFVDLMEGTHAQILDTRKTTPGWRLLEKYAVRCGGGRNHRFGLYDMVLIKDNHLAALRDAKPHAIGAAVAGARALYPLLKVEVEADTLDQVKQALEARADIILLDNMSIEEMLEAVRIVGGRAQTEASGGVGLESARAIALTGVDFISVGAITHSARAMDIGLDFCDE